MNKYLNILARALVAAIFLFSGLGKLIGFNGNRRDGCLGRASLTNRFHCGCHID